MNSNDEFDRLFQAGDNSITGDLNFTWTEELKSKWMSAFVEYMDIIHTPRSGVIYNYSGTGPMLTPPFEIHRSRWLLRFTTDWTGTFIVTIQGKLVICQGVTAGRKYETDVFGVTGYSYFDVISAAHSGHWTLSILCPREI